MHCIISRSLILALHLAYEVRISDLVRRSQIQEALLGRDAPDVIRQRLSSGPNTSGAQSAKETWNATIEAEQDYWLDAIRIPTNVARVRFLRENVYAFIVCAMTKTPLFIVGKPGCSKTLSVSKVLNALSSASEPRLRHLAKIAPFPYQGSRQSTSDSIVQVERWVQSVCMWLALVG